VFGGRPRRPLGWPDDRSAPTCTRPAGLPGHGARRRRGAVPALRRDDDLDKGVLALPGVPLQGGVLL